MLVINIIPTGTHNINQFDIYIHINQELLQFINPTLLSPFLFAASILNGVIKLPLVGIPMDGICYICFSSQCDAKNIHSKFLLMLYQIHIINDWLVVWNMNGLFFHSVGNVIIPSDEVHHFSEG